MTWDLNRYATIEIDRSYYNIISEKHNFHKPNLLSGCFNVVRVGCEARQTCNLTYAKRKLHLSFAATLVDTNNKRYNNPSSPLGLENSNCITRVIRKTCANTIPRYDNLFNNGRMRS